MWYFFKPLCTFHFWLCFFFCEKKNCVHLGTPFLFKKEKSDEFFFESKRLPFDWKNPSGYYIGLALQFGGMYAVMFYGLIIWTSSVGSSYWLAAFVEDAKNELRHCNDINKNGGSQEEVMERLNTFIQLHSDAKQLSTKSNLPPISSFLNDFFFYLDLSLNWMIFKNIY